MATKRTQLDEVTGADIANFFSAKMAVKGLLVSGAMKLLINRKDNRAFFRQDLNLRTFLDGKRIFDATDRSSLIRGVVGLGYKRSQASKLVQEYDKMTVGGRKSLQKAL